MAMAHTQCQLGIIKIYTKGEKKIRVRGEPYHTSSDANGKTGVIPCLNGFTAEVRLIKP